MIAPDYTPAMDRPHREGDRAHLIKVRAMLEALMRECHHPMDTDEGNDCLKRCRDWLEEPMEAMLVDELNPTINVLDG